MKILEKIKYCVDWIIFQLRLRGTFYLTSEKIDEISEKGELERLNCKCEKPEITVITEETWKINEL